ncbi:MAG: hypothetical protein AAFW64_03605 [Pseudomonadota bacterium]
MTPSHVASENTKRLLHDSQELMASSEQLTALTQIMRRNAAKTRDRAQQTCIRMARLLDD